MTFQPVRLLTGAAVALTVLTALTPQLARAQSTNIVPTPGAVGTGGLGTSVSTSGNVTNITGGTRPGNGPNVFHSFNQFSVGAGDVAAFVNPGGASNVISRVIGGSPSNINGTIQALNWNLYFINPSGVIFGPSARLNVTGSAFFGTANAILFSDQRVFSANQFAFDNTLSVAPPASFGFLGPAPYGPVVLSSGTVLQGNAVIGLVGGTVQINGSRISAQRVVVGSNGASGGNVSVEPFASNPFVRVTQAGDVQAAPGTVLQAGGRSDSRFRGRVAVYDHGTLGGAGGDDYEPLHATNHPDPGDRTEHWRLAANSVGFRCLDGADRTGQSDRSRCRRQPCRYDPAATVASPAGGLGHQPVCLAKGRHLQQFRAGDEGCDSDTTGRLPSQSGRAGRGRRDGRGGSAIDDADDPVIHAFTGSTG